MNDIVEITSKVGSNVGDSGSGNDGSEDGGKEEEIITGVITFSETKWNNGKASVRVTKTERKDYTIKYEIENEEGEIIVPETSIQNGEEIQGLNLGDTVYAWLTNGDSKGDTGSVTIEDKEPPTKPTIAITGEDGENGWKTGKVTATITPGTDNESGVLKTTYEITGVGAKAETEGLTTEIEAEGISKMKAYTYDKAGNKTTSEEYEIKIKIEPEITMPKQDGTWDEARGVNGPKLEGTGLTAVYYDESTGTWKDLSSSKEEWNNWYDYADTSASGKENTSKWANARSKDGSMWVWIPRYEYKIDKANESIDIRFISVDTKKGSSGYTTDSTGITMSSDGYIIHPAFINDTDTTFDNGGWDSELSGFWVAKYQAGWQNGTVGEDNTKTVEESGLRYMAENSNYSSNYLQSSVGVRQRITLPVFKANTYAYNLISAGDSYLLAQKIEIASMYGLSNVDSHMLKNSERGAVTYLTDSQYGLNANKSNQKYVIINSKNLNNTINTLGESTKANIYAVTSYGNNNTPNDINASSTKNMTGVFDLNGCLWERTTGYMKGGSPSTPNWSYGMANASMSQSTKYVTLYETDTKKGDAGQREYTSLNCKGYYWATDLKYAHMLKGACYDSGEQYARMCNQRIDEGCPDIGIGFRVCLVP